MVCLSVPAPYKCLVPFVWLRLMMSSRSFASNQSYLKFSDDCFSTGRGALQGAKPTRSPKLLPSNPKRLIQISKPFAGSELAASTEGRLDSKSLVRFKTLGSNSGCQVRGFYTSKQLLS